MVKQPTKNLVMVPFRKKFRNVLIDFIILSFDIRIRFSSSDFSFDEKTVVISHATQNFYSH